MHDCDETRKLYCLPWRLEIDFLIIKYPCCVSREQVLGWDVGFVVADALDSTYSIITFQNKVY